jgi:hypothetical protein
MNQFYALEPEVAGRHGQRTVADRTVHPPIISRLHHIFDGCLGDEILERFPCFLVTERLRALLEESGLSGATFSDVDVEKSEQFEELYPGRALPRFFRLEPTGRALHDDFGLNADHRIVVSERALRVLDSTKPRQLDREALP